MSSEAVLLGKQEDYKKILKRIVRFAIIIFVYEYIVYIIMTRNFELRAAFFNILADSIDWNA